MTEKNGKLGTKTCAILRLIRSNQVLNIPQVKNWATGIRSFATVHIIKTLDAASRRFLKKKKKKVPPVEIHKQISVAIS